MALLALTSSVPFLIFSATCLVYFAYRKLIFKPIPGIPYNKNAAYTLFGDIPAAMQKIKEEGAMFPWLMAHCPKNDTPIYQVFMQLGNKPWVVVADFKEAHDCMLRRTKEFDRSQLVTDLFTGVTPEFHLNFKTNNKFKEHRKLIAELMTPKFLNNIAAPKIHDSVTNLVRYWSLKGELAQGHPWDASADLFDIMLDSITAIVFGLDTTKNVISSATRHMEESRHCAVPLDMDLPATFDIPERPRGYASLVYLMETTGHAIKTPFPRLYHWFLRWTPFYRKQDGIKEELIAMRLEESANKFKSGDSVQRCAVDNVVQAEIKAAKKADRQPDHQSRVIKDELIGFLFGGHDTGAASMSWGFKHIAANPRVQNKLRAQFHETFSDALAEGRVPTHDEITGHNIPYLEATAEEILRHARVFPFIFRATIADTVILGHHIPKGTDVMFCAQGPSFDTAPFDIPDSLRNQTFLDANYNIGEWDPKDATQFIPERWMKTDANGHEYFDPASGPTMPFALGARGCYGRRLAYMQIRFLLIMVLWNMELLPINGELNSFAPLEKLNTVPRHTYLRVRMLEK